MYWALNSVTTVSTNKMHKIRYGLCPLFHAAKENNAAAVISEIYMILYTDNNTMHFDF